MSQPALKMEALAAIINCSVSAGVARRMVKDMQVLKSLVELLWRNTMYTQFVTMLIANLSTDPTSCNSLCDMGAVHALMGLIRSPNFAKQKYACMALANICQHMDDDKITILSDDFIDRVIKLAINSDIDLHVEIATLVRNLSFHPRFADQLRSRGAMIAIAVLKKSKVPAVRDSGQLAARNLMGFSKMDKSEEEEFSRKEEDGVEGREEEGEQKEVDKDAENAETDEGEQKVSQGKGGHRFLNEREIGGVATVTKCCLCVFHRFLRLKHLSLPLLLYVSLSLILSFHFISCHKKALARHLTETNKRQF